MEKRIGTITLAVRDLVRARRFYEQGLAWTRDGGEDDIAFYQCSRAIRRGTWPAPGRLIPLQGNR